MKILRKKTFQTHAIALAGGVVIGAMFKGLLTIAFLLLLAALGLYAYMKIKRGAKDGD